MWTEITEHLAEFDSAVLTWVDATGYPFSARCQARADPAAGVLRLAGLPPQEGGGTGWTAVPPA